MKKRFFCLNKIAGFLILFLCVQILSCNILWNADLKEEIDLEPLVKIHFYSDQDESLAAGTTLFTTTRNYPVGKTISAADLPIFSLKVLIDTGSVVITAFSIITVALLPPPRFLLTL